jgi:DNA-binding HxlR family transcriptional regulator
MLLRMPTLDPSTMTCSIARTISLLGDRWALLVIREAALGTTRFSDFKQRLRIASDVLTDRLQSLVAADVLERVAYQEEGSRSRTEYRLTDAGREFGVVLGALGDWGRTHVPADHDSGVRYHDRDGRPVHVRFVDEEGRVLEAADVAVSRR